MGANSASSCTAFCSLIDCFLFFAAKGDYMNAIVVGLLLCFVAAPVFSQGAGVDENARNRNAEEIRRRHDDYVRREQAEDRNHARQAEEARKRQQEQEQASKNDRSARERKDREICRSKGNRDCD